MSFKNIDSEEEKVWSTLLILEQEWSGSFLFLKNEGGIEVCEKISISVIAKLMGNNQWKE